MKIKLIALVLYSGATFAHHKDDDHKYHPRTNFKYNYQLQYDDKLGTKIKDDPTYKDPKGVVNQEAGLGFDVSGIINDDVSYKAEIRADSATKFLNVCHTGEAWAHMKAHDMVSIRTGCLNIEQGGWAHREQNMMTTYRQNPARFNSLAFESYEPALQIGIHAFGDLLIQLAPDRDNLEWTNVTSLTGAAEQANAIAQLSPITRKYNKNASIAPIVSWSHDFSGIKPLLQFSMYDDMNSMYINAGVAVDMQGLDLKVDFGQNNIASAAKKADQDVTTSYSAYLAYNLMDMVTPYFRYSKVDVKLKNDDTKMNPSPGGAAWNNNWKDNGQTISAGLLFSFGPHFHPYFAFDMVSGDFQKADDATKEETKSNMNFALGFKGEI